MLITMCSFASNFGIKKMAAIAMETAKMWKIEMCSNLYETSMILRDSCTLQHGTFFFQLGGL